MIGSAQAGSLPLICGVKIAFAEKDDLKPFKHAEGGKYAGWAIAQIEEKDLGAPAPSAFRKVGTSDQTVQIGATDQFIMMHWGKGGNDEDYQLIDVRKCAPGDYHLPSPRSGGGGLSWVGRISGGGSSVPDGGTTLILMGLALCGVGSAKSLFRRSAES